MTGLLLKDLMLHKKMLIRMALGYIFVGGFSVLVIMSMYYGNLKGVLMDLDIFNKHGISGVVLFISFCAALMGGYMATSVSALFTEDKMADFGKVSYSLPVSARDRIRARYGMYGICLGIMLVLNMVVQPFFYLVSNVLPDRNVFLTVLAGFFPSTVLFLIGLPFIYRFGPKSLTMINMLSVLIVGLTLLRWVDKLTSSLIPMEEALQTIIYARNVCAFLFVVVLVIGFPLSGAVSVQISRRKMLW